MKLYPKPDEAMKLIPLKEKSIYDAVVKCVPELEALSYSENSRAIVVENLLTESANL